MSGRAESFAIPRSIPRTIPNIYPPHAPDGCRLYLDMQDPGDRIVDHSGLGNHGISVGATRRTDRYGFVRSFDGIDDYIDCGASPALDFGTCDFSIAFWVRPDNAFTGWKFVMAKCNPDTYLSLGWNIMVTHDTGQMRFRINANQTTWSNWHDHRIVLNTTDCRGRWCFITVVAKRDEYTAIYHNGVLEGSENGLSADISNPSAKLNLGRMTDGGTTFPYLPGRMGQVTIFNRALPQSEIMQLYREDAWRYGLKA